MKPERKINDQLLLEMYENGNGKSQAEIAAFFKVSGAAVCKRLKRLCPPDPEPLPESLVNLTEKEQRFVIEKAQGNTNVQAVMNSFDVTTLASAKAIGTELMKKPEIQEAIEDVMNRHGLTKDYRIGKLKTHVDCKDPGISLKGLDMSFRLDGSYAPEKHDHQISVHSLLIEAVCKGDSFKEGDKDIITISEDV